MENSYVRRLGKTQTAIEEAEVFMAQAKDGTLVAIGSARLERTIVGVHAYDEEYGFEVIAGGVGDALSKLMRVKDALLTVAQRGRAYSVADNRVTVHVWSKDVGVLKNVKEAFGGNYYKHGSGLTWMCSKRSHLEHMWKVVSPHLPPNHRMQLLEEMCNVDH